MKAVSRSICESRQGSKEQCEKEQPDAHRPDVHRPDVHRPDVHRPDAHRPDAHRPDTHREHCRHCNEAVCDHEQAVRKAMNNAPAQEFCVDQQQAGLRLDHALKYLLPHMGLRGRRRCIENSGVSVNGLAASASRRMRQGDVVRLHTAEMRESTTALGCGFSGASSAFAVASSSLSSLSTSVADVCGLRMLDQQGEYCFFSKPARMHSASLAGASGVSVEALAPALAARWLEESGGNNFDPAQFALLQRLDFGTSGLLCAALSAAAADAFRADEEAGRCEKRYVALLSGVLSDPAVARQVLDVSGRRKSRLLPRIAHYTRWTEFWPLHVWKAGDVPVKALQALFWPVRGAGQKVHASAAHVQAGGLAVPANGLTLAACRIRRGARHQIRAHAAGLGHALWGDSLYAEPQEQATHGGPEDVLYPPFGSGNAAGGGKQCSFVFSSSLHDGAEFFLHHGGLRLPGVAVTDDPPWPLPGGLMNVVRHWLTGALPGESLSRM